MVRVWVPMARVVFDVCVACVTCVACARRVRGVHVAFIEDLSEVTRSDKPEQKTKKHVAVNDH